MIELFDATVELADDRDPWERQPGENSIAWQMFQAYRDMAPAERSAVGAHKKAFPNSTAASTTRSSYVYGRGFMQRFRWKERASAYDRHMDQEIRDALLRQQIVTRKETARLGRLMRLKAQEALEMLEAVLYDGDGNLKSALGPSAIAQLAKAGSSLERFALGLEPRAGEGARALVQVAIFAGSPEGDRELLIEAAEILDARKAQSRLLLNPALTVEEVSAIPKAGSRTNSKAKRERA